MNALNALNYSLAIPEIFVLSMACLALMADVFFGKAHQKLAYSLTLLTLLIAVFLSMQFSSETTQFAFNGLFISDPLSTVLKIFIYVVSFVVLIYSRQYLEERNLFKGEYFVLVLFAVLGMMIMVSAANFLPMYLGLELLSLSMYAMVAMYRDSKQASEAAMKFFVLGAIASGMLLYGMSMIYGATGSLDHSVISNAITNYQGEKILLIFGLVFIVAGIAFKLGAAPFHMWAPDVYQGAPTAVTMFIGTAPKLAGFILAFRLLVDALMGLGTDWQQMLIILSILSIGLGNVVAVAQTNIKRMLAYSAIAHMGYMLLGLLAGTQNGFAASLFYTLVYTIMTAGAFGVVILLRNADVESGKEADQLQDIKGLGKRCPWLAFIMLMLVFSMAGVPPFVGFWSKWFVLKEIVEVGHLWLAVAAVFFAIIGAFFYLRIVRLMYFDSPEADAEIIAPTDHKLFLGLNGLVVLALGLMPGILLTVCIAIFS
ncbi:MAG: NADH-quinone oxidoreductase subunit NuoN [Gammaproteobacteria bacterium]